MCQQLSFVQLTDVDVHLIIISVKELMFIVLPGVCLSVCSSVSNFTLTSDRLIVKFLPDMYLCSRKN